MVEDTWLIYLDFYFFVAKLLGDAHHVAINDAVGDVLVTLLVLVWDKCIYYAFLLKQTNVPISSARHFLAFGDSFFPKHYMWEIKKLKHQNQIHYQLMWH